MQPRVSDISHHNTVTSFSQAADAGLWGIIHKATQGSHYVDPDYRKRRAAAKAAGLLWGAYHFNDGTDVVDQVANFLQTAEPESDTLLVLDYEDNPHSNMSITQLVQFLKLIESRGYTCAIYSGNRLKETIGRLDAATRTYVCSHMLWLCQYGPRPVLPRGFDKYFLWQYTDGRVGPTPRTIAGIHGEVDLNVFEGTREDLEAVWTSGASAHAALAEEDADFSEDGSSHSRDAAEDNQANAPIAASIPPFLGRPGDRVKATRACQQAQQDLYDMGYYEVGNIDGRWSSKTVAAVAAFYNDREIDAKPAMDQRLVDALDDARNDLWRRPVSNARATATVHDLKHSNDAVRLSLWQRFCAKIGVAAGGLGLGGTTLSSTFYNVQDQLQPVKHFFASVPPAVWFLLIIAVAGAVWYASTKAANSTVHDYSTGRLN